MKAVAYQFKHTLDEEIGLTDVVLPEPIPLSGDLLVEVKAISVNPADTKVRKGVSASEGDWKILGWDAAGVVKAVGADVTNFKVGDEVWYAGDISRQGSYAQYQAVDAHIVSHMPSNLSFDQAAAMPLTSLTAWELLFDRMKIDRTSKAAVLIIGAAGGVGSILIQLLRQLTELTIIATASRPDSIQWVTDLGAHHVINHRVSLQEELARIGLNEVQHVISLTHTDSHAAEIAQILAPQGQLALIDDPVETDFTLFKRKSITICWESMFTRALFSTADKAKQGEILSEVAQLVDNGKLKTTMTQHLGIIEAENIKRAHHMLEEGVMIGKAVLADF